MALGDVTFYLVFNVLVINLGSLLFGYHLAELNAPEAILRCQKNNTSFHLDIRPCIPMSTETFGLVTSVFSFGGLLGAISAGSLAERFGRKRAIMFNCLGFIVGPALMACSQNVFMLSLGRIISGISAGSSVVIAPLYIHNVAPTEYTGAFGASTQVIINFGIFLAQTLGLFLSTVPYWRLILAIGGFIGLAQLILLPFCVESPKWLVSVGRIRSARKSLSSLRGRDDVEDEIHAFRRGSTFVVEQDVGTPEEGLLESSNPASQKQQEKISLYQFLTGQEYRRQLFAVMGIMIAQQFLGINAIVMYGVSILGDIIPTGAARINVMVSMINLVVTVIAARLIDRFGRKPPLLVSIAGMGIFAGLLGTGILLHLPILSGVATLLFVASFGVGLGPLPFMIVSELVDGSAVGAAQSFGLTVNWLATFTIAYGFPSLRVLIGSGEVFFVFTGLAVVFFLFVWKFVPETKGKEVDEVWGNDRRAD